MTYAVIANPPRDPELITQWNCNNQAYSSISDIACYLEP